MQCKALNSRANHCIIATLAALSAGRIALPLPKSLADAIRVIGNQESWRVHHLPQHVTRSVLEDLFKRDLIEYWPWVPVDYPAKRFDPSRPVYHRMPGIGGWVRRGAVGHSFGQELDVGQGERSPEIRLTVRGRDALDALPTRGPKPTRTRKRPKRTIPTQQETRAMELKSRGYTGPQIANEMDITVGRVSQLLKSGAKRSGPPSRSIDLSKAEQLMDHDGSPPKSKRRTRAPMND